MKAAYLFKVLASLFSFGVMTANAKGQKESFQFLFPGTKWCGIGDIAKNYSDLGVYKKIDLCCREHDKHCLVRIQPLQRKYHRTNISLKVKSDCQCEKRFKRCLKKIKTYAAKTLFQIYFHFYKPDCIKLKPYTYKRCVDRKWYGWCAKHEKVKSRKAFYYDLHKELNIGKYKG